MIPVVDTSRSNPSLSSRQFWLPPLPPMPNTVDTL